MGVLVSKQFSGVDILRYTGQEIDLMRDTAHLAGVIFISRHRQRVIKKQSCEIATHDCVFNNSLSVP